MPLPVALLVLSPILVLAMASAMLIFSMPSKVFAQAEVPLADHRQLAAIGMGAIVLFMMVIMAHNGYYWIKGGSIMSGYDEAGVAFIHAQTFPVLAVCLGIPLLATLFLHSRAPFIEKFSREVRVGFLWRIIAGWSLLIASMAAYLGLNSLPWRSEAWMWLTAFTVALFLRLGIMSQRARGRSRVGTLWPLPYALAITVAMGMLPS